MARCLVFAVLISMMILAASSSDHPCTEGELGSDPCRCCKMRCWYEVNDSAAKALGYMPGTQGEEDALNALAGVRECMQEFCTHTCIVSKAVALAAFGDQAHGQGR